MTANQRSTNDLEPFKILRSEQNLDKSVSKTGSVKRPTVDSNKFKSTPKKVGATGGLAGKSPQDQSQKTLGRSSSQKTIGLTNSVNKSPGYKVDKKLNSTMFDANISIDYLNNTVLSTESDLRKTFSGSKGNYPASTTNKTLNNSTKAKMTSSTIKPTSNITSLHSPKGQLSKSKLNINSTPVPVKKK